MRFREEIEKVYLEVLYCALLSGGEIVLRVGQKSPALESLLSSNAASGAVFITAHNPFGVIFDSEKNCAANALLRDDLERGGKLVFPGYGSSQDGHWQEASYLALPISQVEATALCQRYFQNAVIFVNSHAIPELIFHPKFGSWGSCSKRPPTGIVVTQSEQ